MKSALRAWQGGLDALGIPLDLEPMEASWSASCRRMPAGSMSPNGTVSAAWLFARAMKSTSRPSPENPYLAFFRGAW